MTGWVIVSLTALAGFMIGVFAGFWVSVAFLQADMAEDGAPEGGQVRGLERWTFKPDGETIPLSGVKQGRLHSAADADGGDGREVDF